MIVALPSSVAVAATSRSTACRETWAPGVKKLVAHSADGIELGTIYLDLYQRPGKYTGCALFTVVCGKEMPDGSYRSPTVVLCCSLPNEHSELPLDQVQTMFHEMGHGVNSVLCRNRLQHLFGARGALDVVEIPSHVLERIARSPQVIAALLGGSETAIDSSGKKLLPGYAGRAGEPPSGVTPRGGTELAAPNASKAPASAERTLRAAEVAQRHCEHLGVLDGLVMPRLDCALHGPNPPKSVRELRALVHGITEEVMGYEVPPETYARLSIHHLVTYGGMCHAYPYAEAIAELVWERHLRRDLRDGAAGRELAAAVLEPGGAVDAAEALEKLCPGIVESVAGGFCPVVA